jgi:DNA-binding LacI/PurR family transcriptional regulator
MGALPPRPTIRDVAGAAGVSVGTASHALNGTGRVAASTRARVAAVADRLGYRPDPRGRALRSTRTTTLGLVLPVIPGPRRPGEFLGADFYLELAGAAAQAAFAREHGLLLLPSPRDRADLERFAVDGAMLSDPEPDDARLRVMDALGIPVVTLERDLAHPDRSWWVAADNHAGTWMLLDHLAAAGAETVALFTVAKEWSWFAEVDVAYRQWCAHRGVTPCVSRVAPATTEDALNASAARLLASERPGAVLAPPERLACAVLRAADRGGLRVPDDLRIAAGVDGRDVRAAGITALDLVPEAHADAGVDLLLERLAGGAPATRLVEAHLRIRGSSR